MVKKSAAPVAAAPAKKAPAKKASKKETNAREAFKAPVDGDTGQPADVPMTSGEASQPDKAPAGGWGSAAEVDTEEDRGKAGDQNDDQQGGTIGWGLDGQQQMVDEEGKDASEAGKVAEASKAKGPRIRKNNPDAEEDRGVNLTGMAKDLVSVVERVERIAEERAQLGDDIKEVLAEAKSKGYSTAIIREAIRRRAMDPDKRKEHDDMLSLYEEALRGA